MSVRVATESSPPPRSIVAANRRASRTVDRPAWARRGSWVRLALIGVLLAASGACRLLQERRIEQRLARGRVAAFPLAAIPMTLGPWDGRPTTLDPRIVRGSGSTDVILRHYVDRRTGAGVDAIVTFGPTSDMFIHVPELCYPAAGYQAASAPLERSIKGSSNAAAAAPFRSLLFTKGDGGRTEAQEVYYSLWYDGHWTTASSSPKASKRIAGMYKVQVSRRISERERRDIANPSEAFLAELVAEIETRMAASVRAPFDPSRVAGR